jgi:O-antigen ligase
MRRLALLSLWIFVFCVPWENAVMLTESTISRIAGLAAGLFCSIAIVLNGRIRLCEFALASIMLCSYVSLTILWSSDPDYTFEFIRTVIQITIMVVIVHQFVDDSAHVKNLFLAYVLGSCVAAFATIYAFQTASDEELVSGRFAGSNFNENTVSSRMALAIAMAWYIALTCGPWYYRCILVCIPVNFYASMLSGSRSGFVATIIALCMPLFCSGGLSSRARATVILGVIPLMSIGLFNVVHLVPENTLGRIATLTADRTYSGPRSLNGRLAAWEAGFDIFARNPLIGAGIGTFAGQNAVLHGSALTAHNVFIGVAAELGLIGLALFLLVLSRFVKDIRVLPAADRRTWWALILVMTPAFMFGNWTWNKETWLLLALATAHAQRFMPTRPFIQGLRLG